MRAKAGVLSATGLLCMTSGAKADVDKAKLRKAAVIQMSSSVNMTFQPGGAGYRLMTDDDPPPPNPDALAKSLHRRIEEADRYSLLADLYTTSQETKHHKAAQTAVELFRKQLATRPNNGILQAKLANALWKAGEESQAKQLAQTAIRNAPHSWRPWVVLGYIANDHAFKALFPKPLKPFSFSDAASLATHLQAAKLSAKQFDEAEKLLRQGQSYFNQAIAVAPNTGEAYAIRASSRGMWTFASLFRAMALAKRMPTQTEIMEAAQASMLSAFSQESVRDLVRAARLSPDQPMVIGTSAFLLLVSHALASGGSDANHPHGMWEQLSPAEQSDIDMLVALLEKIEEGPQRAQAAVAAKMRGVVFAMAHGAASALPDLRRSLALAPEDVQTQILLDGVLLKMERWQEAATLIAAQMPRHATARRHLMLAKAYSGLKMPDKAHTEIETAIKLQPRDFAANMALAAHLLHRAESAEDIEAAGEALAKAHPLLPANASDTADYNLLHGIYFGLKGQVEEARAAILAAQASDKENSETATALQALGT